MSQEGKMRRALTVFNTGTIETLPPEMLGVLVSGNVR